MQLGTRPVIVIGHGCTEARELLPALLDIGIPVLSSWQAADLMDNTHPSYFGRPGIYGQRIANKVMYNADHIISIGCRLSVWMVGYGAFQREGKLTVVDIDEKELERFPDAETICSNSRSYLESILGRFGNVSRTIAPWVDQCQKWRQQFPWLEPQHHHTEYINPHRFVHELGQRLRPDEIIVTDCATGNLCAHQILQLKPPQRLMTSGGLGEMGCGLPAAIGASFASNKGRVICLMTDGAMSMNVQELETIRYHDLPIKIVVFSNDGYGMIRGAQRNLGMSHVGVSRKDGVSCPNYVHVAEAYGIASMNYYRPSGETDLDWFISDDTPSLLNVEIDPAYQFSPKLQPIRLPDGTIKNATFEEMV